MSPRAANWLNTAWMLKCGVEESAFARASHDVEIGRAHV